MLQLRKKVDQNGSKSKTLSKTKLDFYTLSIIQLPLFQLTSCNQISLKAILLKYIEYLYIPVVTFTSIL